MLTRMSDSAPISTPEFGPGLLGPIPRPTDQKLWDPAHQAMDPGQRRQLQDERVRTLVRRVLETPVPLFAAKLAEAGITSPDDIKGVDDLARVPLTVKQDLRDSEAEPPPWGHYRFTDPRHAVRLGTSTGTTGQPTITVWTRKDIWSRLRPCRRRWTNRRHPPSR